MSTHLTRPDGTFDAFISYSSADHRRARRLHRFLESYRKGSPPARLAVYLDHTDIRGGVLHEEIRGALARANTLIVCASPAAAESRWVAEEIRVFREIHGDTRIAVAMLEDVPGPGCHPALAGLDCRRHDLRRAWKFGVTTPAARLEMLRLLAFTAGVDLRTLRNWHRRRALRNGLTGAALSMVPAVAVLAYPVTDWRAMELQSRDPLYPIAAEVTDSGVWVASRYRAPGAQGFRNYIRSTVNALDSTSASTFQAHLTLTRRLLPTALTSAELVARIPRKEMSAATARPLVGESFVGEPRPGTFVAVQAAGLTDGEDDEASDMEADGIPVSRNRGSVVAVVERNMVRAAYVPDLRPLWRERDLAGNPTSPSRAPSIAWSDDGHVWLGVSGWDGEEEGGLWHSRDRGLTWSRVKGFRSVSSIGLRTDEEGMTRSVVVAESHFEGWRGYFLEPYPTRVVESDPARLTWREARMPPFGDRSGVEFCGSLEGMEIVRVDETLFQRNDAPLWRFLLQR
jgi:hypothetical protein